MIFFLKQIDRRVGGIFNYNDDICTMNTEKGCCL